MYELGIWNMGDRGFALKEIERDESANERAWNIKRGPYAKYRI